MNSASIVSAKYMQKIDEGRAYFVAWTLVPPPHHYGEWALVSRLPISSQPSSQVRVQFHRALSPTEIRAICSAPYLWWGMKLANQPWALVMCTPGTSLGIVSVSECYPVDSLRSTGV